jgi:polysaccharide biosynthesis protein PslG
LTKFSSLVPVSGRLSGIFGLFCVFVAVAAISVSAQARGVSGLSTEYPTALSVQIDPATISNEDLNEIRAAGFEFVRFGVRPPLKSVNPALIDYPNLIRRVKNAKLEAIVTLFGGREIWGHDPSDLGAGGQREKLFANFALDFMNAHAADVAVWELWNEPDHKTFLNPALFSDFQTATAEFCRSIAQMKTPPNVVMGFGFAKLPFSQGQVPLPLENAFVSAAKANCLTDISIHPYRSVPETAVADYGKLRGKLDELQLGKVGIVASEWGYASYLPVRDRNTQASLIFREYLTNVAAGIKLLNLYAWQDRGTSAISREDNFGLKSKGGEKKEAFSSLSEFLKIARNSRKVSYESGSGLNKLVLSRGNSLLHVVWTQSSEQNVVVPAAKGKKCTRVDFFPQVRHGTCGNPVDGGFAAKATVYPFLLSISD